MGDSGRKTRRGAILGAGLVVVLMSLMALGLLVMQPSAPGIISDAGGLSASLIEESASIAPGSYGGVEDAGNTGDSDAASDVAGSHAYGGAIGQLELEEVRRSVTGFALCDAAGKPVGAVVNALGARATWVLEASTVECAQAVLEEYEAADVELCFDGYLDLFGRVWGCTVWSSEGWSEVVVVDGRQTPTDGESESDAYCLLTIARFGYADCATVQEEV